MKSLHVLEIDPKYLKVGGKAIITRHILVLFLTYSLRRQSSCLHSLEDSGLASRNDDQYRIFPRLFGGMGISTR